MKTNVEITQELRELNLAIGAAERAHDFETLDAVLHEDLIFRRADGSIVDKATYFRGLGDRTYESLEVDIAEIDENGDTAVVTTDVTASGTSKGKPFAGTFRNVRTFVNENGRWRCKVWINTRAGLDVHAVHHVSLPVSNLERSSRFYREILGLREIDRPPFGFPGAWFQAGAGQLHLIVGERSTFRGAKGVDSRDVHFAVRVRSYSEAKEFLESKGYSTEADDGDPLKMRASPRATAGFPQLYILDPDRHVIEINAEKLDAVAGA